VPQIQLSAPCANARGAFCCPSLLAVFKGFSHFIPSDTCVAQPPSAVGLFVVPITRSPDPPFHELDLAEASMGQCQDYVSHLTREPNPCEFDEAVIAFGKGVVVAISVVLVFDGKDFNIF
jgi:hypothetical protein